MVIDRFDRQWDRPYGLRLARGRGGDATGGDIAVISPDERPTPLS
jgi:hypothetical protein